MTETKSTAIVVIIFLALMILGMYFYSQNVDRGIAQEYQQLNQTR